MKKDGFDILVSPVTYIINLIINNKTIVNINSNYPIIPEVSQAFLFCFCIYLKYILLFFLLRFILYWFPNINPYSPPYSFVLLVVRPYNNFFRRVIPIIGGVDISFFVMFNIMFQLLRALERFLNI